MNSTGYGLAPILEEPEIDRLFDHGKGFCLARKRERVILPLPKRNQASGQVSHSGRKPTLGFLSKPGPEEDGKAALGVYRLQTSHQGFALRT